MADCVPSGSEYNAISNPVGIGSSADPANKQQRRLGEREQAAEREEAERSRFVDEATTASAASDMPAGEATPGETKLARGAAKRTVKALLQELADAGWWKRVDSFLDAIRLASGTSKLDSTFWMNLQDHSAKWFVNARNDLNAWLRRYAALPETAAFTNPLIRTFNSMIPKIRGMNSIFTQRREALKKSWVPIARNTGYSLDDVGMYLGFYLSARHAKEGNAHLLSRWREQLADAQASNDVTAIHDLSEKIISLESHINNPDPPKDLAKAGYTDAQAEVEMQRILDRLKISREEADGFARAMSSEFDFITSELAKAGAIHPEQIRALPDFEFYSPIFSQAENSQGVVNDSTRYLPMARRAMEGSVLRPDDAYNALIHMGNRAATEIGMQDTATMLASLDRKFRLMKAEKQLTFDPGIKSLPYESLLAQLESTNPNVRKRADAILSSGGIVADVPTAGGQSRQRRYIWFDSQFVDGNITGPNLNKALSGNYKTGNAFVEGIAKTTSFAGQTHTRFSPFFAPVSGMRDGLERIIHIVNREYFTEDGRRLSGTRLAGRYVANTERAARMLYDIRTGKAPEGSYARQLWEEFIREGGDQKYTPGLRPERLPLEQLENKGTSLGDVLRREKLESAANWLEKRQNLSYKRAILNAGEAGKKALQVIDGWNEYWQGIPAFAQYLTLREAKVPAKTAAQSTIEIMNMSQTGTVSSMLSVIAPFVRPTMQGATAFARTMGLGGKDIGEIIRTGKKGWIAGLAASAAYAGLAPMLREAMGYDEQGRSYWDAMSISKLTNATPIGLGDGSYFKLPSGFGPQRVAAALAFSTDRVFRGLMEPSEAAFEVLLAAARDTVPGNQPGFNFGDHPGKFIMHMVCPSILLPLAEETMNLSHFGTPIYNDFNADKALADQGRKSTPPIWHRIAKDVLRETGFDFAPESYAHLFKGLSLGPLRLITTSIVNFAERDAVRKGWEKPTAMEELPAALATLGGTLLYGKERNLGLHYYNEARDELRTKAKRLGIDTTAGSKQKEEGANIVKQKLLDGGFTNEEADDFLLLRECEKKLRSLGSAFGKKHKFWYDEEDSTELRTDFENLSRDSDVEYDKFFKQSNYYRNLR